MANLDKNNSSTNGVIVTMYEESATLGSSSSRPQNDKIRATNSNQRRSRGYDRRAELLAQVHQHRNGGPQQVHQDPSLTHSLPKPKKKRSFLAPLRKFRLSFGRFSGERKKEWRYESIETEEHEKRYRLCRPRRSSWSKVYKRFCSVLRRFPCGWKRNKGFYRDEHKLQELDVQYRPLGSMGFVS